MWIFNKFHIDLQIIQIIAPILNVNAYTKYFKTSNEKQIKYNRIFTCIIHLHSDIVYIIMTASNNVRLFHCDLALCDNGTITIGTFICILSLYPVEKNMQTIPILSTDS